ncbi:hypothetical protein EV586_103370 [Tumebacillus sp. BK434]|uniref:hypothetical protein n=1 Tax=Tumebacillus sp. BK434 TaxID=2512169 RepID=UPI001051A54B|nr:hypothetical protein [Tumebacillus sp. BK434]TCP55716.1 hypothetical protein EV586_103370 [Tumebacillus sp. BK434]
MVEGIGGSSSQHQQMSMQRQPVKYVQHDFAFHTTLSNGSRVVQHETKETIVAASATEQRSHTAVGQRIDVYC